MKRNLSDQLTAVYVQETIEKNGELLIAKLTELNNLFSDKTQKAYSALNQAQSCVENVRDFVSKPERILGSTLTKHGEVAEKIEVEIRRGKDYLRYIKPTATFHGVGRTAPEDYLIDGFKVQSKFHNNPVGSLEASINFLKAHVGFTDGGYCHIPKDQYELIERVLKNENIEGLNYRTATKIRNLAQDFKQSSGMPITEAVKPGISTYREVQLGKVGETLDKHEQDFRDSSNKEVEGIREEHKSEKLNAQKITEASWGGAAKAAGVSAVISGTFSSGILIYTKIKDGKKIREFSLDDWKDIGYDFGKASLKGGIRGLGIYGLTNIAKFNAPFAGAVVSTVGGIASLATEYISAIGATIGQILIPFPALGAVVGVAVSKGALEITRKVFDGKETALINQMQKEYEQIGRCF